AAAADERGGPGGDGLRRGGAVAGEAPAGAAAAGAGEAAGGDGQGDGAGPPREDGRGGGDGDLPAAAADRQGVLLHLAGGRDGDRQRGGGAGAVREVPQGDPGRALPLRRRGGGEGRQ